MCKDHQIAYGDTNEYFGDSTQLTYLRSRYYSSGTGRFLTRDTWGGDYNRPLSLNRWNYTSSNPINYSDPSGHCQRPDGSWDWFTWPWFGQCTSNISMPSITPTPTLLAIIIATACATPPPTSTSTSAPTGTPIPTPQTGDLSPNDIKILTVLIAGESSSGYVPDDISYMKAWALLNKHAWDRLQPDKKNWTPFESWKHPERPLLDSMKISGSVPGQITSLLNQYQNAKSGGWKYLNDPQRFASIEATVNRAINSWALYGPKSGADLTNGAVGFTDAGGKCFPKGKCKTIEGPDGKPQLATFNMMGEVYQNAITGEAKIEDWRFNYYAERSGFFSTKTYQFGLNDYSQPVYTFTVFEYQPWPAFTWP